MTDNLKKRSTVFPVSRKKAAAWARNLDIPEGGATVLYTGSMYQLLPYMIAAVKRMERMEDSFLGKLVHTGRIFNRLINVSAFIARPSRAEVKRYGRIIGNIALLLKRAGVEFGYLYGDELYAGALAYDMGVDAAFREHALRVHEMLKQHGVRSLITIDPHTTNVLRSVYPTVIDDYDLEVTSYLEALASSGIRPLRLIEEEITVHDSCVYARYEGVVEQPRELLRRAGYRIREPVDTRELTHCCGGPIESIFPKVANRIGEKRARQLREADGSAVATMCPICMATLRKASDGDLNIDDISSFLMRAYCDGEEKPDRE
jgi:Fe-S oxidoreductase